MIPPEYEHLTYEFEPDEDPAVPLGVARDLANRGEIHGAATFYNRAYGLAPQDPEIVAEFAAILNRLEVREHDMTWRYVPGGVFLMGSLTGEPDERPWHPVWLDHYWIMDACVSWDFFVRKLNLESFRYRTSPPWPNEPAYSRWNSSPENLFDISAAQRYAHSFSRGLSEKMVPVNALGELDQLTDFAQKPMAYVPFELAHLLGHHLTPVDVASKPTFASQIRAWMRRNAGSDPKIASPKPMPRIRYRLPTEAEWEKAARGGLIGAPYAWGWDPPTSDRIDCDRLFDFGIKPMRSLPPNTYGLYGMCGGVWEWTGDYYDSKYYLESESQNPTGPLKGEMRVVRGGSWADCLEACTVSFRNSKRENGDTQKYDAYGVQAPSIGFRLVRTVTNG